MLLLASCGEGETSTNDAAPDNSVANTTTPTTEATADSTRADPTPTAEDPTAVADPSNRDLGRTRTGTVDFDGRASNQFYVDGRTLSIVFSGSLGPIEDDPCAVQFELDAVATPAAMEVAVYSLAPGEPPPTDQDCPGEDIQSEFITQLPEPLDGRPLIGSTDGVEIPVSDVALLRSPTVVPADWEVGLPTTFNRETTQQFGPVTVISMSANTRTFDRVDGLKNNPNHEVREIGEGVEAVLIPRPNGTQRLGFVIDEWFYDLEADVDTPTDDLLAFADSFEIANSGQLLIDRWNDGEIIPLTNDLADLTFYTRGPNLVAAFPSIDLIVPVDSPCSIQYEPNIEETADAVDLTIVTRLVDAPTGCIRDPFVTLTIPVEAPLGARTLRYDGETVRTTAVFARLSPTAIPASWEIGRDTTTLLLGGTLQFGPAIVSILPASDSTNIEAIRETEHESVDILDTQDGALLSGANGGLRLAFEDSGWVYDIEAQPEVERDVLIEFAQSFQ